MSRWALIVGTGLAATLAGMPLAGAAPLKLREPLIEGVDFQGADISRIIYLERCVGGCTLTAGPEDARINSSSILQYTGAATAVVSEFSHDEMTWQAVVDCVRELYAPYDVEVTDVDPGPDVFHHKAIVAGSYEEIEYPRAIGGVAPSICFPRNNAISYTFANQMGNPLYICSVVGQETAHAFGLEHAHNCADPMTYLGACGRQFFRNEAVACGEYEPSDSCVCGGNVQNSHAWLKNVLGANPTPIAGPTIDILLPEDGATVADGFSVSATALHVRGVKSVRIEINGEPYGTQDGYSYQNAESPYWFDAPADLPDGILDIKIIAANDLGVEASTTITVTKGSPCTSADTCLTGQQCEDGRCFYPPPSVELGGACADDRECLSGLCPQKGDERYCSQTCFPGVSDQCPAEFDCLAVGVDNGVCWPRNPGGDGGGCDTSGGNGLGALALVLLGVIWAARRRRYGL